MHALVGTLYRERGKKNFFKVQYEKTLLNKAKALFDKHFCFRIPEFPGGGGVPQRAPSSAGRGRVATLEQLLRLAALAQEPGAAAGAGAVAAVAVAAVGRLHLGLRCRRRRSCSSRRRSVAGGGSGVVVERGLHAVELLPPPLLLLVVRAAPCEPQLGLCQLRRGVLTKKDGTAKKISVIRPCGECFSVCVNTNPLPVLTI